MSKIIQQAASASSRGNAVNASAGIKTKAGATTTVATGKGKAPAKAAPTGKGGKRAAKQTESSVIYLGHIPQGFFEAEMRKFFSQFGLVKRLKLFRSAKTNGSKGYAFIEFESPDIANTVAEAMDGYFIMERQLVSSIIPLEKHHDGMFKTNKKRALEGDDDDEEEDGEIDIVAEIAALEENVMDEETLKAKYEKHQMKLRGKQKKLKAAGIDFEIQVK